MKLQPSGCSSKMVVMGTIEWMKVAGMKRAIHALDRLAHARGRAKDLPPHLAVGIVGEDAVFWYLRGKGYTVVARRWSSGDIPGDVDLIAWKGTLLCFIEVKTRTAHDTTPAEVAVNSHKRAVLRRLARRYLRQLPQISAPPVRFDVISVYLVEGKETEFHHFEGAFSWSEEYSE